MLLVDVIEHTAIKWIYWSDFLKCCTWYIQMYVRSYYALHKIHHFSHPPRFNSLCMHMWEFPTGKNISIFPNQIYILKTQIFANDFQKKRKKLFLVRFMSVSVCVCGEVHCTLMIMFDLRVWIYESRFCYVNNVKLVNAFHIGMIGCISLNISFKFRLSRHWMGSVEALCVRKLFIGQWIGNLMNMNATHVYDADDRKYSWCGYGHSFREHSVEAIKYRQ